MVGFVACVLSLDLQGQLCGSWNGFACGHCDCLLIPELCCATCQPSGWLTMKSQLVFFLFA